MVDHPTASPPASTSPPPPRTTRSGAKSQKPTKEPTPQPPDLQPFPPSPTQVPETHLNQSPRPSSPADQTRDLAERVAATEGEGRVNATASALSNSDSPAGDAVPLAAVPHPIQSSPSPDTPTAANGASHPRPGPEKQPSTPEAPPPSASSPSSPSHVGQPTPALPSAPAPAAPSPSQVSPPAASPKHSPDNPSTPNEPAEGPTTGSPASDNLLDEPQKVIQSPGSVDHDPVGGDQPGPITAVAEAPANGEPSPQVTAERSSDPVLTSENPPASPAAATSPTSDPSVSTSAPTAAAQPATDAGTDNANSPKQKMDLQFNGSMGPMGGSAFYNPSMIPVIPGTELESTPGLAFDGSGLSAVPDMAVPSDPYAQGLPGPAISPMDNAIDPSSNYLGSDPSAQLQAQPHPEVPDTVMDFSINDMPNPSPLPISAPPEVSDGKPPDASDSSGFDPSNPPPPDSAQASPSWAPTLVSEGDTAGNSSTSATMAGLRSPSLHNAGSGSQNESRPATATDPVAEPVGAARPPPPVTAPAQEPISGRSKGDSPAAAKYQPSNSDAPGLSASVSGPASGAPSSGLGVSPNTASTAVNSDAGDAKIGSPASVKGVEVPGDPKAGLVLALNEQLIKICSAYTSGIAGTPLSPDADQFQARLASNLNWLASVADTSTNQLKPGAPLALPILVPPKAVTPSPQATQCAEALGKLPFFYARMQELFKVDYERKMKREHNMRMRAAAANAAVNGGMGAPGLPPPGTALPVAGVKRERDAAEGDVGDRKRMAIGATNPMEAAAANGGSPTRASVVRAGSLALSQTQSPVMASQSPIVGAPVGSAMSTPRLSSGYIAQSMNAQQQRPQVGGVMGGGGGFGAPQTSPVSSVPPQQQQQRQPSLPPHSQHSPTHQQQMQGHFAQPGQPPILAQTTGGSVPSPQRPPSVTQNPTPFQQAQPSFQAPGMISRVQQPMIGPMGMNGTGRPPVPDDQRTQSLPMQLRQHMAAPQGPSQVSPSQTQGPSQVQAAMPQTMGGMQQTSMGGGGGGGVHQLNQGAVQQIINNLQNPQNALTQHLYRTIPNFGSLPPQAQIQHFHAAHTRLLQQQQQQQQQQHGLVAGGGMAGNPNANALVGGPHVRPPSAAGGMMPGGMAGLRNMRQGTASPRISGTGTAGGQAMATPMPLQRQVSGQQQQQSGQQQQTPQQQQQQQMTMSPSVPPLGMGHPPTMTPHQRQMMMMMQQQQASVNSMMPSGATAAGMVGAGGSGGSPSPFGQAGRGLAGHGMTPSGMMGRVAGGGGGSFGQTSQSHGPVGGVVGGGVTTVVQQVPQTHGQWAGAGTPGGYVSSPLNPGWSPQTAGGPGMAGASPVSSGGGGGGGVNAGGTAFHVAASPAPHSDAGATPRHSAPTPQSGMGFDNGTIGGGAMGGDYENGGDPSALFNESWAGNGHVL